VLDDAPRLGVLGRRAAHRRPLPAHRQVYPSSAAACLSPRQHRRLPSAGSRELIEYSTTRSRPSSAPHHPAWRRRPSAPLDLRQTEPQAPRSASGAHPALTAKCSSPRPSHLGSQTPAVPIGLARRTRLPFPGTPARQGVFTVMSSPRRSAARKSDPHRRRRPAIDRDPRISPRDGLRVSRCRVLKGSVGASRRPVRVGLALRPHSAFPFL